MKTPHEYTYTTRRMSMRDDLVFKSIIRILHGQTRHDWHFEPSGTADLMVIGPQAASANEDSHQLVHPAMIRVGCDVSGSGHLALPLRVGDVLVEINRAGEMLADLKHTENHLATDTIGHAQAQEVLISLLRWPVWDVLQQDSRYLRVATVLATGPSTISLLASKSGVPVEVCDQLVRVLKLHELINTQVVIPHKAANPATPAYAPSNTTQAQNDTSSPATLWHRIRRRLGMNIAHTNL